MVYSLTAVIFCIPIHFTLDVKIIALKKKKKQHLLVLIVDSMIPFDIFVSCMHSIIYMSNIILYNVIFYTNIIL